MAPSRQTAGKSKVNWGKGRLSASCDVHSQARLYLISGKEIRLGRGLRLRARFVTSRPRRGPAHRVATLPGWGASSRSEWVNGEVLHGARSRQSSCFPDQAHFADTATQSRAGT